MLLIPDKLVARLKSRSRSWTRYQRQRFINARRGRSKESLESSPQPGSASLYTAQSHPQPATRYDLEAYGNIASHSNLNDSKPVIEPAPAMIRDGSAR